MSTLASFTFSFEQPLDVDCAQLASSQYQLVVSRSRMYSYAQAESVLKGKQLMEVVTKENMDPRPSPTDPSSLQAGSCTAPSLDKDQGYGIWVIPCQLIHKFREVFTTGPSPSRRITSIENAETCAQPGGNCSAHGTYDRIQRLEHELAHSRAAHQHDSNCMQKHFEMLHMELCKARAEMFSQAKLSQEQIDFLQSGFAAEIQVARTEINHLRSENERLKGSISKTFNRNQMLVLQIETLEQEKAKASSAAGSYLESLATPQLLETAVQGVKDALGSFSKELLSLMKSRNWDIFHEARKLQPDVRFSRLSHVKFAFQSHICRQLFRGFEKEDFDITSGKAQFLSFDRRQAEYFNQYKKLSSLQASDLMMDTATQTPDLKDFNYYFHKNYIGIVPEAIEISLFGNNDLGSSLKQGKHPDCEFYYTFFRLSKLVWALHRLAFSFEPHAHVIRVESGGKFDGVYMRSVVMDEECDEVAGLDVETTSPAVGFMVLPGFRVSKCIVKSQVYLNLMNSNVLDQE